MKRILIALAGYAIYRWWNKPEPQPEIAGTLPVRKAPARKPATR